MAAVMAPPSDRTAMKRLPHLPGARRRDDPARAMKVETARLPIQAEEGNEPAALALEVGDHILVANVELGQPQNPAPVRCKPLGFDKSPRAVCKVVGEQELAP